MYTANRIEILKINLKSLYALNSQSVGNLSTALKSSRCTSQNSFLRFNQLSHSFSSTVTSLFLAIPPSHIRLAISSSEASCSCVNKAQTSKFQAMVILSTFLWTEWLNIWGLEGTNEMRGMLKFKSPVKWEKRQIDDQSCEYGGGCGIVTIEKCKSDKKGASREEAGAKKNRARLRLDFIDQVHKTKVKECK